MKKSFLIFSLISFLCAFNNISLAQKSFEGVITYTIEYEELPDGMEGYEDMLPKETTMKIKESKTKTVQNTAMGPTVSIYDADAKTAITLINMMGNKVAIKTGEEEMKKEELEKEPKITYIDETKEIAGYQCKKAVITYEGGEESITIYYTEEINTAQTKSQYKGLKGFPMQYEISNQGMKMLMTVKEIKKEKISDSEFTIPKDYEIMTMEEFQKMMGGQINAE